MADERTKVCDYPSCTRRGAKVTKWRLDNTVGFLEADLCPAHAAPVVDLIDELPPRLFVKVPEGGSRGRTTSFQKVTLEQIEADKKRGRR